MSPLVLYILTLSFH